MGRRPPPSLKARAIAALAMREHSRSELQGKLLRQANRAARAEHAARAARGQAAEADEAGAAPLEQEVERLLNDLQAKGLLSEARFIETRVRARSARFGNRRIQAELAQHGLRLDEAAVRQLQESEIQRAQAVWQRKFGIAAPTPQERARQMRFLAARGFSADTIRRVIQASEEP